MRRLITFLKAGRVIGPLFVVKLWSLVKRLTQGSRTANIRNNKYPEEPPVSEGPKFITLEEASAMTSGTRVTFVPGIPAMFSEALMLKQLFGVSLCAY